MSNLRCFTVRRNTQANRKGTGMTTLQRISHGDQLSLNCYFYANSSVTTDLILNSYFKICYTFQLSTELIILPIEWLPINVTKLTLSHTCAVLNFILLEKKHEISKLHFEAHMVPY